MGQVVVNVMFGRVVVNVMKGRVEVEGEVDCEMDGGRWNASGRRKVGWVVGEGNDSLCWTLEGCLGVAGFLPFLVAPVSRRYLAFIDCQLCSVILCASAKSQSLFPDGGHFMLFVFTKSRRALSSAGMYFACLPLMMVNSAIEKHDKKGHLVSKFLLCNDRKSRKLGPVSSRW